MNFEPLNVRQRSKLKNFSLVKLKLKKPSLYLSSKPNILLYK